MPEKLNIGCKTNKSTLEKKTGSWRTFRPIITEKCTGCGQCIDICPEGTIKLIYTPNRKFKKKVEVNYDYCKGCLICADQCPFKAIDNEMEK